LPSTFKFGGRRATLQATALAIPPKRQSFHGITRERMDVPQVVQVVKSAIRG
jgi:hypothetical protein